MRRRSDGKIENRDQWASEASVWESSTLCTEMKWKKIGALTEASEDEPETPHLNEPRFRRPRRPLHVAMTARPTRPVRGRDYRGARSVKVSVPRALITRLFGKTQFPKQIVDFHTWNSDTFGGQLFLRLYPCPGVARSEDAFSVVKGAFFSGSFLNNRGLVRFGQNLIHPLSRYSDLGSDFRGLFTFFSQTDNRFCPYS